MFTFSYVLYKTQNYRIVTFNKIHVLSIDVLILCQNKTNLSWLAGESCETLIQSYLNTISLEFLLYKMYYTYKEIPKYSIITYHATRLIIQGNIV